MSTVITSDRDKKTASDEGTGLAAPLVEAEIAASSGASSITSEVPRPDVRRFGFDLFAQISPFVLPLPFFISVVLSFAICSWLGYRTTLANQFKHFERFHTGISPDSDFYPTLCEIRAILKSRVKDDQILVVVGGNSIFNGVGQQVARVWTRRLQELLGDRFVVVNAAFRGAFPFEGAYVAFESFIKEHPRSIYVTVTSPAACGTAATDKTYSYFYFDAMARNMLLPDRARTARIVEVEKNLPAKQAERRRDNLIGIGINRFAYCTDFWNMIGYRKFFTVWSSLAWDHPFAPRKRFADCEPLPAPLPSRFKNVASELRIIRGVSETLFLPDKTCGWSKNEPFWKRFDADCRAAVPESLRRQVLVATINNCPFYVDKLTDSEHRRNDLAYAASVETWRSAGYNAVASAMDFTPADFVDRCHLSISGGEKVADQLSKKIKQMCEDLKFVRQI